MGSVVLKLGIGILACTGINWLASAISSIQVECLNLTMLFIRQETGIKTGNVKVEESNWKVLLLNLLINLIQRLIIW